MLPIIFFTLTDVFNTAKKWSKKSKLKPVCYKLMSQTLSFGDINYISDKANEMLNLIAAGLKVMNTRSEKFSSFPDPSLYYNKGIQITQSIFGYDLIYRSRTFPMSFSSKEWYVFPLYLLNSVGSISSHHSLTVFIAFF